MKFSHALGFLAVGLALAAVPHLAPRLLVGNPARELWLVLMSWLQIGLGGAGILRHGLSLIGDLLRYEPAAPVPTEPLPVASAWDLDLLALGTQQSDTFAADRQAA